MTPPEKTWLEFADEGIWDETEDDKITCPFCKHEHTDDIYEYVHNEEFTCEGCGSIMALSVREITEFTAEPLVDNRTKELKEE